MEEAGQVPGIGPPRRVVALRAVVVDEREEVEQGAEFAVLELMDEGLGEGEAVRRPGDHHGAEGVTGGRAEPLGGHG